MPRSVLKLIVPLIAVALASVAGATALANASTPGPMRVGAPPPAPAGSTIVGSLAPSTAINTTVTLKPRDPAGLENYATEVATPGSSVYHQYLSVAEFRQRFGPTDAQIDAVSASLRAHGLTPGPVSANGLAIPVSSDAGGLSHAFSTSFNRLSLRSGRTAFANTQAPLLDASIAGDVQGVLGLSSAAQQHPLALHAAHASAHAVRHVATGGAQPCAAASATGFYTADELASAYRFSSLYGAGDFGAGQTVAVYELEGNFPSDISADEACYGIGAPVSYVRVDGGPPSPSRGNQDGLETALDVEQVINLAPSANVIVYQAPNTNAGAYDNYNAIISQGQAHVITTSWGECESQLGYQAAAAENALFQEAAVQGESVVSATGDDGSTDCTNSLGLPTGALSVDDPSSQPFVTGVGGTSMTSAGPPPTESVWNDTCQGVPPEPCAGGGGVSGFWAMPSFQSTAAGFLNVINGNSSGAPCGASLCRETPDVSANADPSTADAVYYDGWGGIGGTSAAAPVYAALMGLADASSACGGSRVGFANPALYRAASANYSGSFQDIKVGDNNIDLLGSLYPAGPGYDMASGLGSPDAAGLVPALCASTLQGGNAGSPTAASPVGVSISNPGSQRSRSGNKVRLQVAARDNNGAALSYFAAGLPGGVSIDRSTGLISGKPTNGGGFSVAVTAAEGGAYASTRFAWNVNPAISPAALSGVGKNKPKLWMIVTAQPGFAQLKTITVTLPKHFAFSKSTLAKGITLLGPNRKRLKGYKLKLGHGKLTITLKKATAQVRFTIARPSFYSDRAIVSSVKRRKAGNMTVTINTVDASRQTATVTLKLKAS